MIYFRLLLLSILCISFEEIQAQNIFPTAGHVGIGTVSPADLLNLNAGAQRKGITINSDGDANAFSDISLKVNTTANIPVGKPYGWHISHRKDGYFSNNPASESSLEFYALRNGGGYFAPLSFKSNGDIILASVKNAVAGNVGIGTTSPTEKLSVKGKIRAQEIKVEASNWPDYVFEPSYNRVSLSDLETYIRKNKHLPEIPSETEVRNEGISLGEMNALLLKKIEELTLHLIEQAKDNEEQTRQISALQQQVKELSEIHQR